MYIVVRKTNTNLKIILIISVIELADGAQWNNLFVHIYVTHFRTTGQLKSVM